MTKPRIVETLGNKDLLMVHKTAFLCSRNFPATVVLKCFDWAIAQREAGQCVISGFHSRLEKDVLAYLLKGRQPVIVALARGMKARIEPELKTALANGRLLIITPFGRDKKRMTSDQACIRNVLMAKLAQEIVVGYASAGGNVELLLKQLSIIKSVSYLQEHVKTTANKYC